MKSEIKEFVLTKLHTGNVRVNITKIGYDDDRKYDTTLGVWIDGELDKVFELENVSNKEIDEFAEELNTHIRKNTLFLI